MAMCPCSSVLLLEDMLLWLQATCWGDVMTGLCWFEACMGFVQPLESPPVPLVAGYLEALATIPGCTFKCTTTANVHAIKTELRLNGIRLSSP